MTSRLAPRPKFALVLVAVAVAVVALLGVLVHGDTHGNRVDNSIYRVIHRDISTSHLRSALHVTDPTLVVSLVVLLAVGGALARRWDVVALAVIAPSLATVTTERLLKPVVGRKYNSGAHAYPSGHETGIASLLAVVGVLVFASALSRVIKIIVLVVLLAVGGLAAVALIGLRYHYASDTVGGVGVAVAVAVGCALVIDLISSRTREPAQAPR